LLTPLFRAFPHLPIAHPQPAAYPLIERWNGFIIFADAEVIVSVPLSTTC
jgi:hypothetical protein